MKHIPNKLEIELSKVTGVTRKKNEEDQAFLKRIAIAVDKMDQKKYSKMSPAAQTWYEAAVACANSGDDLPWFSKVDEEFAPKSQLKIGKKKEEKPVAPTWKELKAMDEDDLTSLADSFEVNLDRDFDDIEEVQDYIAKKIGIEKPAKIKIGKPKKKADEEPKLPGWSAIHRLSESKLIDLIEEHDINLGKKEFDSLEDVADFVCEKLGIERPANAPAPKPKKKAKPVKKAKAKKAKKPAPKKPVEKKPSKRELAHIRKMARIEKALRTNGFRGQALEKVLNYIEKL